MSVIILINFTPNIKVISKEVIKELYQMLLATIIYGKEKQKKYKNKPEN